MKGKSEFFRGVIEGFYGRPWSAVQRRQLFDWMGAWKLTTYLYAPKDDVKHRALWRSLYSNGEAAELRDLIHQARVKGIDFIYAIAPGLDICYGDRREVMALCRKLGQLIELGCRHFAILFDDIAPELPPRDRLRFASIADAQCFVSNLLLGFLRRRQANDGLFFCPTPYCARMSGPPRKSPYLQRIGELLDPAIRIFWTGPEIVSESISIGSIRELRRVLRRKPVLWDNLHANDYDLRRIFVGPYSGRPLGLRRETAGILCNPNCEFEANYVPLRTFAQYASCRGRWNPRRAFRAALGQWAPRWKLQPSGALSAKELEWLCDCFYLPYQLGPRAAALRRDLEFLLRHPPARWGAAGRRFETAGKRLMVLSEKMNRLKNRELLYAFYRLVWELKEEMELLKDYVHWLKGGPGPGECFISPTRHPKVYRGGLVAALQRLVPMDEQGRFHHPRSFAEARHE